MERIQGTAWAIVSSATFGLAPLFTLLLIGMGYSSFEVLSYRWGVASLCLGGWGLQPAAPSDSDGRSSARSSY